jgi:hypothetical protein
MCMATHCSYHSKTHGSFLHCFFALFRGLHKPRLRAWLGSRAFTFESASDVRAPAAPAATSSESELAWSGAAAAIHLAASDADA